MADPIMWPERSHRPVRGLRLSVSASTPQTTLPPVMGVPESTSGTAEVDCWSAGATEEAVWLPADDPQAEAARAMIATSRGTTRRERILEGVVTVLSCRWVRGGRWVRWASVGGWVGVA